MANVKHRVECPGCGWRGYRINPTSRDCPSCQVDATKVSSLWLAGQGPGRTRAYLLCWAAWPEGRPAGFHADHYLGKTSRMIAARLQEHLDGYGARLVAAAIERGAVPVVARVWEHGSEFERAHKQRKGGASPRTRTGKRRGSATSLRPLCPMPECRAATRARNRRYR